MSANTENSRALDEVESAAARWLLRQDSADWSAEDLRALEDWLQASPHHRVAYIRLRSVWRQMHHLKSAGVGRGLERTTDTKPAQPTRRSRRYAAAAVIVIVVTLGVLGAHFLAGHRTFETPIGGLATVPTDDGSVVTLNTDTRIQIAMDAKERRIALQRGEAFFEVAKDERRPFRVEAGRHAVIAVGTKFSVRVISGSVHVAVTEGTVRVEPGRTLLERPATDSAFPALSAGTTATVRRDEIRVQEEAIADIEQTLSWRSGYVVLNGTSLAAAAAELNRYNTRRLIIADPEIERITVGGNFRSNNVDGFVRLLEQGFGIEAEVHGNQILLRRRQR